MFCVIDTIKVPVEREKRKGFAGVTCSDECYAEFRRKRREMKRDKRHYIPLRKWLRFRAWEEEQRQGRQATLSGQEGPLRSAQSIVDEMQQ